MRLLTSALGFKEMLSAKNPPMSPGGVHSGSGFDGLPDITWISLARTHFMLFVLGFGCAAGWCIALMLIQRMAARLKRFIYSLHAVAYIHHGRGVLHVACLVRACGCCDRVSSTSSAHDQFGEQRLDCSTTPSRPWLSELFLSPRAKVVNGSTKP